MRKGHKPNIRSLRRDLYRLLSVFMASQPISKGQDLFDSRGPKTIATLLSFQEDEATELLLSIAVTLRVLDDREDGLLNMFSSYCGQLTEDANDPLKSSKGLTLREACNKIIHARSVEFAMTENGRNSAAPFLEPFMYFEGVDQRRRKWLADLDITKFVHEGISGIVALD